MRGAAPQFFAHRLANLVRAVGDHGHRIGMIGAAAIMAKGVIARAEIAMTAGL